MNGTKTVIWDLSGTLFSPQSDGMTEAQKEEFSLLFYLWSGKKEASPIDQLAYRMLTEIDIPSSRNSEEIIRTHTGEPVPEILCHYLAGKIDSHEATSLALSFCARWAPQQVTQEEHQMIIRMITTLFNSESLAQCMKPIEQTVKLFHETISHAHVFILSNWDHDSFIPFFARYKETVFASIERHQIIISADCGFVKPERAIYRFLLEKKGLIPSECIFLDDQEENIRAAQQVGIEAVRYTQEQLTQIRELLKSSHLI